MRLTNYIVTKDIYGKGKLLFNCKTNKAYFLSSKYVNDFDHLSKENNIEILSDTLKQNLEEWEFITTNSEIDDYNFVRDKFNNIVNSHNRLRMTILPTDACNFKCVYCCQTEPYHTMDNETQYNVVEFIKNTALSYKSIFISWFGGEPLLAFKPLYEMSQQLIMYAHRENKPYLAEITTNGYLLDVETFLQLLGCKIRFFQITIDGNRQIHNINRPHKFNNDSFERIYNNLIQIKKVRKRFRLIIRLNITPEIADKLEEIIAQFKLDFGDDERFVFAVQPVRDWGGERINEYKKEIVRQLDYYNEKINFFNQYGLKLWDMNFFSFGSTFCDANYEHSYIINPLGELLRCSIAEYDEKYKQVNHVGKIINGQGVVNQYDLLWRKQTETEDCKRCQVYPLCCRATCKLGFNISKCADACKKEEMIQYLQLFLTNKYMRNEIDGRL